MTWSAERGIAVVIACVVTAPLGCSPDGDPCVGVASAVSLGESFVDITQTLASLRLLNGAEDPKLKRGLELRLIGAVASARRSVDLRPEVGASLPSVAPNWLNALDEAKDYVESHQLDSDETWATVMPGPNPSENLLVIREWLLEEFPDLAKRP
jgi:hypothetical protein